MASRCWPSFTMTCWSWPTSTRRGTWTRLAATVPFTRSSAMSKVSFTLAFSGPEPCRPRYWPLRFHRGGHGEMGHGAAVYAGPRRRVFTIGVGGPVGSGKTALVERLCREFWPKVNLAVITNDIYTREDAEFLARREVLPLERIVGVETGGCPHSAIREDASVNLAA